MPEIIKIACIGARKTPKHILDRMERIGSRIVEKGYIIATGNALGADEYFANGGNNINPKNVYLFLPWEGLNENLIKDGNKIEIWGEKKDGDKILSNVHKFWNKAKEYVKQTHRRNYGIIKDSKCVVCYTSDGKDTGGTGIGIRIANILNIPVFNLYYNDVENKIYDFLDTIK